MNRPKTSYGLNEEEQEMINVVREFAEQHVAPRAAEIDQTAQYPWDLKEHGQSRYPGSALSTRI